MPFHYCPTVLVKSPYHALGARKVMCPILCGGFLSGWKEPLQRRTLHGSRLEFYLQAARIHPDYFTPVA